MVTAKQLEYELTSSNSATLISEYEANNRNGILIEREISMKSDEFYHDYYSFIGDFILEVEAVFTGIFADYRVGWFTGYKVKEVPSNFGRVFKVSTIAVQMSEREWLYG